MANHKYLRGRRLEWAIQKLFKESGFCAVRAAGSHGVADVIVFRDPGDEPLTLTKPIPYSDITEVLDGWLEESDPKKILDPFLFGKKRYLARGGTQTLHMIPAQVWLIQAKSTKG